MTYQMFRIIVLAVAIVIAAPGVAMTNRQGEESFAGFMQGIRANAVKGEVFYQRNEGKFEVEPGLRLEAGDVIKSAPDAYAELLLQPGNYLRIGSDTEFQIFSDEHDRIRLKLNRGSLTFELLSRESGFSFFAALEAHELIRVITPGAQVFMGRPGIFRINASGERTDLIVRDGEAVINGRRIKKKRRAAASKEDVSVTEIDAKIEDAFDAWGRARADALVKANKSLKKDSPWSKKQKEGLETSVELPQEEERSSPYVVSAKPGTVNFVEPGVEFSEATDKWQQLTEKSQLESGDKVRTDTNSFAELTLFPDMYLRIDEASEVLLEQLSNDSIGLKLLRGAIILDVVRFDRKQIPEITIGGPNTAAVLADAGNYRVDAGSNGDAIMVRDGKVTFNGRSVGSCRRIASSVVSNCDKKQTDNFDYWSQHRGEGEFFNGRSIGSTATLLTRLRRLRFRNTGFWYQNPGQTSYTFVPFTSQLFRSPYGGNYSTVLAPRPLLTPRGDVIGRPRGIPGPRISRPPQP